MRNNAVCNSSSDGNLRSTSISVVTMPSNSPGNARNSGSDGDL